jgi:hypothetical protein
MGRHRDFRRRSGGCSWAKGAVGYAARTRSLRQLRRPTAPPTRSPAHRRNRPAGCAACVGAAGRRRHCQIVAGERLIVNVATRSAALQGATWPPAPPSGAQPKRQQDLHIKAYHVNVIASAAKQSRGHANRLNRLREGVPAKTGLLRRRSSCAHFSLSKQQLFGIAVEILVDLLEADAERRPVCKKGSPSKAWTSTLRRPGNLATLSPD